MSTKLTSRLGFAGVLAALLATAFAAPAAANPPAVYTKQATQVGSTVATLNGTIFTQGEDTEYTFAYGLTEEYGNYTSVETVPGEQMVAHINAEVTDLEPGATYHFVLTARHAGSNEYVAGDDLTFSTAELQVPLFEAGSYPATVAADQGEADAFTLFETPGGARASCDSLALETSASAATDSLTFAGSRAGCQFAGLSAVVTMNSCGYALGLDNAGPPFVGDLEIACDEPGDAIEIKVTGCTTKIAAQSPGGSVAYENQGKGDGHTVGASVEASGVSYTSQGLFCNFVGSGSEGSIGGELTLSGTDGESDPVGVAVAGGELHGIFVDGEASEEEASQPRFEAYAYPAQLSSDQSEADAFTLFETPGGARASCDALALDASASAATDSLTFAGSLAGCQFSGLSAVVTMNSCGYALGLDNAGPPFVGDLEIACDEPGDAIEIKVTGCTTKIAAQSPGGSVAYENQGKGDGHTVGASVEASGVSYTSQGLFCGFAGSGSEGSIGGELTLRQTQ